MTNMFAFMLDRIEHQNIRIGKMVANHNDTIINFYFATIVLTTNSLIFDKKLMSQWWQSGYDFGKRKNKQLSQLE